MKLNLGDLAITSSAFQQDQRMPARHAADHENVSPALSWSGVPAGADQLVLLCHDPDAPLADGFTHWVLYNIPADVTSLAEGQPNDAFLGGINDTDATGYFGPLPPQGHGSHHYYFHLYAIEPGVQLPAGLTRKQVLDIIADHIITQARIVGVYSN